MRTLVPKWKMWDFNNNSMWNRLSRIPIIHKATDEVNANVFSCGRSVINWLFYVQRVWIFRFCSLDACKNNRNHCSEGRSTVSATTTLWVMTDICFYFLVNYLFLMCFLRLLFDHVKTIENYYQLVYRLNGKLHFLKCRIFDWPYFGLCL